MTRISVVIPNYNGREILPACLNALLCQTRPPDEIIVVDDASVDDSPALVCERYPQVTLIVMPVNRGFCRAANAGLRAAKGDLLALLNNDTEADPDWLAELVAALEAYPDIGFCASKMLFYDRRDWVNSAGLFMRVDGVGRDIGYGQPDGPEFATMREVFGASGGAAIYRRAMLNDIGLFDEDLVAYAEDLDLSFRAQLRGYRCLYVPAAVVYHRGSITYQRESPAAVYYGSRNMLTVILKNMPTALLRRYWLQLLAAQLYQVMYFSARGRGWPALLGKIHALRYLRSTLDKRRAVQQARRVSDVQIESILSRWGQHGRLDNLLAVRPAPALPSHSFTEGSGNES